MITISVSPDFVQMISEKIVKKFTIRHGISLQPDMVMTHDLLAVTTGISVNVNDYFILGTLMCISILLFRKLLKQFQKKRMLS